MTTNPNSVQLRDVVRFHYGSALKACDRVESGPHPVFGSNGPVGSHNEQLVTYPTVMIGRKGSVGSVYYAPHGGWPIDTTYYTEITDPEQLHLRYLFYALKNACLDRLAIVTSIPGLNRDALYQTPIPLPPLSEQKRIADILDKADAIRRKRQKAEEHATNFLASTLQDMFGDPVTNPMEWPEATLQDVAHLQSGVTKGRKLDEKETVDVAYMRVWNVQDGHLRLDDIKDITVLPADVDKYRLEEGDLLLTEGGDPDQLGRGAIWYAPIPLCIHQNHIFRVRADQKRVIPEFLSALIGSQRGKRYFLKMAKQTTGIASINMTQLKKCPVFLPPLDLQRRYAEIDRQFEKTKDSLSGRFDVIDDLFNSLVQRAFNGSL